MKRLLIFASLFFTFAARAHVGSPDVFYDGMVGPYPARITIRMPNVVPGRAEISARVLADEPVEVSFLPVYARTAVTNAPPADIGRLVKGETNLYTGELWLMDRGAYSVEVRATGGRGDGKAQIPVTSVAIKQLPMPSALGKVLLLLAAILIIGGVGIAAAAGRDAALLPGAITGPRERRKGNVAAGAVLVIFMLALLGGQWWWKVEERAFRSHLREGAWPDLAAEARVVGSERVLRLEVGNKAFKDNDKVSLIPDHGKLMHLFLIREGSRDAFAHLHPIRKEGYAFEVAVPPLPEGRYTIYCDLTFEGGFSSTATNSVVLPPMPAASGTMVERDADDSWAAALTSTNRASIGSNAVYRTPDGTQITWQSNGPLRTGKDASLRFSVTNPSGEPIALDPYMGMLSHAAVLRSDGSIFAHLHPSGNFSMAAQMFFENKLAKEIGANIGTDQSGGGDHAAHHHHAPVVSSVYLPYEFPEPGDYRIFVQFKTGERVITAVFDTHVGS